MEMFVPQIWSSTYFFSQTFNPILLTFHIPHMIRMQWNWNVTFFPATFRNLLIFYTLDGLKMKIPSEYLEYFCQKLMQYSIHNSISIWLKLRSWSSCHERVHCFMTQKWLRKWPLFRTKFIYHSPSTSTNQLYSCKLFRSKITFEWVN